MKPTAVASARLCCVIFVCLFVAASVAVSRAEDDLSASGRITARGVYALHNDSATEDPSLTARVKLDASRNFLQFHSLLEAGWDGTVRPPRRDKALLKNYREVYQDNTPFLEFKELYLNAGSQNVDFRLGVQRFAWGRLDEYPINDLFNPWDFGQNVLKPMEDRKIGVPSALLSVTQKQWAFQAVWVPWAVPYRIPKPNERWSGVAAVQSLANLPDTEIDPEQAAPPRTLDNGSAGLRVQRLGEVELALNLFSGNDPWPVFRATALNVAQVSGKLIIDPGYVPSFHRITVLGADAATVIGDWSLRGEAAYTFGRFFNIRTDLWGYPQVPALGRFPLNPIEVKSDAVDYGVAADYRLFEDGVVTLQAQQTYLLDWKDTLYDRALETVVWAHLKVSMLNQKVHTALTLTFNPEHGAYLVKMDAEYALSDAWKVGLTAVEIGGPSQSLVGRFSQNDQIGMAIDYYF